MRWLQGALVAVGLGWSLMVAAWLGLHWVILPHIPEWRASIETRASRALGVPVRIGGIRVQSSGWVPSFELRDVVLVAADGRPGLRLPRVVAAVSPRSLLMLRLDFEQLLIDGPVLDVTRDAAGRISVAGLPTGGSGGDDPAATDWLFRQRELVIRAGALRWTDALRQAMPLALTGVDVVLRNGLREHAVRIDATPPAAWGHRFTLTGRFTQPLLQRHADWRHFSGSLYASLPRADVRELRRYLALPFELSEGSGALRGWLDVADGEVHAATVDAVLRGVVLRLAPKVSPLAFAQIEGRFAGTRDARGTSLEARRFGFSTTDGMRWPPGALKLAWRATTGGAPTGGSFEADRLDLGLLARVAAGVPIGDALHRVLDDVQPRGVATALAARWDGAVDAPTHYRVSGGVTGLTLAARAAAKSTVGEGSDSVGRPGVRNANLQLEATEAGGTARVDLGGGALELPGIFAEPLVPLSRGAARLAWHIDAAAPGTPPGVSVELTDALFANADARLQMTARWAAGAAAGNGQGGRTPGRLELTGTLADGVASRLYRYLPLGLSPGVRDYVRRAVLGGRLTTASIRVAGDLRDFPFFDAPRPGDRTRRSPGEFRIVARADDATFAYAPARGASGDSPGRGASGDAPARAASSDSPGKAALGDAPAGAASAAETSGGAASAPYWPALTHASGELRVDRNMAEIRNVRARLGGVEVMRAGGRIEHLEGDAMLTLDAAGHGSLSDMLGFMRVSPIGTWTGHALTRASATGDADLTLALTVPLAHPEHGSTARGSLRLAGNDVRLSPATPPLGSARGRVDFTQQGFELSGATARVYGGELAMQGGTQADGSVRFAGQGTATAEGLRGATEWGLLARLATTFTGRTGYRLALGFGANGPEIGVTSNLVGLASSLPAPLDKRAETALPLRYQTAPGPLAARTAERPGPAEERVEFALGPLVQAHWALDAATLRVLRGGIGVQDVPPQPTSGVAANVRLKTLDATAWQDIYERLIDPPELATGAGTGGAAIAAATGPAPATSALAASASADASNAPHLATAPATGGPSYAPDRVALHVQELGVGARRLTQLTAGLTHEGGSWRVRVDADQLAGDIEVAAPGAGSSGRVKARLARLSLPKTDKTENTAPTGPAAAPPEPPPASLPALDIVVDDLEFHGMRLGRLEVQATNRAGAPMRSGGGDWRLNRLSLTTPEAEMTATGAWGAADLLATGAGNALGLTGTSPAQRRMALDFRWQIGDSGALLDQLGTPKAIRGGKGKLSGHLAWLGSPFALDYPSLSGDVAVAIEAGQFLKAEPGAARLLGVVSLQSLPRRLTLDFRDIFEQGFAFDSVDADLSIARGVAQTRNFRMRGVQATVLLDGRADIEHETQDLHVVVIPEINAGTAALAYAAINPALGLGAFVAQWVLRKPLMAAGTREFEVRGRWDDPVTVPVERPRGAERAAAGASAALEVAH